MYTKLKGLMLLCKEIETARTREKKKHTYTQLAAYYKNHQPNGMGIMDTNRWIHALKSFQYKQSKWTQKRLHFVRMLLAQNSMK